MQLVNLVLLVGLLANTVTGEGANGVVALTPVAPKPPTVLEEKQEEPKPQESTVPDSGDTTAAVQWNEFVKTCKTLEETIVKASAKHELSEAVATEFRSDLAKVRAHVLAVKPKTKDIGFSQKLVISRDLGDLKAKVDDAIGSAMHPHENVEAVKKKFLAELDEAEKSKKIAPGDVEKLNAEVKQQDDLMKSMRRGSESLPAKDQELISNNFAGLHVALQRRIAFSQESLPLIDEQRKKVEEMLANASSANTLDAAKCTQFKDSLAKITSRENEAMAKGPLSSSQIIGLAMELEGLDEIVQNQINASPESNHDSK